MVYYLWLIQRGIWETAFCLPQMDQDSHVE